MNSIINFCMKNKFAVWLLTIIVVAAGLYSGVRMKLETIPNITAPVIMVSTVYPGATPDDIAEKVTKPIEQRIKNLPGVDVVTSTSSQNVSSIQVQYQYSKDMDKAETEVKEAVSEVTLPDKVQAPKVSKFNFNEFPILSLSITNSKQSLEELTKTVEEDIVPSLEGIDGVAQVQASGQYEKEVDITFDKKKLAKYGLTEDTVKQLIQGSDVSVPLGLLTFDKNEKAVVVDGNIHSINDLKNLKIPYTPQASISGPSSISGQTQIGKTSMNGQMPSGAGQAASQQPGTTRGTAITIPTVKLADIADVKIVGKHESISKTNGENSIGVQISKSSDANTVDVADKVNQKMDELKKNHDGLKVVKMFDQATPIKDSVNTMLNKAIIGALFAVIIILLFLRDFRSTIISVISIPLSLLIAILLLKQMDISLNMMTLGAMTVAIGRVVDDSIVVIENIYRRMSLSSEKLRGMDLIREATKEMFKPIMSSTIVTIAVFLPLGLVTGMVGELFLPFALTIVFALLASLLVAITIVPMFANSLFKGGLKKKHEPEKEHGKIASFYKKILNWSLNHKLITFGLAILIFIGSLLLIPAIGVSFIPSDEQKMVMATYKPDPGQTKSDVEKVTSRAEKYFENRAGVKNIQYSVGADNPMNPGNNNSALFYVEYNKDAKNFDKEPEKVIKDLQAMTNKGEWKSQNFASSGGSNNLELLVYGDNVEQIKPVIDKIENIMKQNKSLKNVDSSLSKSYEQYTLVADQSKLAGYGLTAGQIGMQLNRVGQNPVLTTIQKDGKDLNVYVTVDQKSYRDIDALTNTKVKSSLGTEVALKDVMKVQTGESPDTISRRDGKIYEKVSAEIKGKDVSKVSANIKKKVDKIKLPSNVEVSMGGVTKDINESFSQLGIAMLAAIAIVYLVLVITFGGAVAPFAILFSLPFTVIGGLVALLITGETLSISSMIGALMLIGIVVTNAIVLIDRVIHKQNDGLSTREALLEAGATRIRPILMTALATIGALLPLAFGFEGSGLISKDLGVTVIGGLTSSTLLTLIIVPVVYEFLMKFKKKKKVVES
ncbi:efflux RND transporter permease subunit [Bacillus sp. FJAT-49736]|uniref:efflux RND transporter permease subunit n=1 Tax=Bacillus sp. FJAT-49736 TaxID=2833582 RepID=UPI001BCA5BF8|nr:efflux RND transporter permease subunit [Bacillus sp. FJAT-49736]MBS4173988.1 efflux RND transporter permease subunit [Bacillus sp. FJAT-49736]